jgi:glucose-6-phosphate isomerase
LGPKHLRELIATDADRWRDFHLEYGPWLLDVSRQRITRETLSLLYGLARARGLPANIEAMFRGDPINTTERRAVLHTALRSEFAGSPAIQAEVRESRAKLANFVGAVRRAEQRGSTGRPFKHVINIGIGGSDLGPLLERGHHAALRLERRSYAAQ